MKIYSPVVLGSMVQRVEKREKRKAGSLGRGGGRKIGGNDEGKRRK